jgi:hypothetical protein
MTTSARSWSPRWGASRRAGPGRPVTRCAGGARRAAPKKSSWNASTPQGGQPIPTMRLASSPPDTAGTRPSSATTLLGGFGDGAFAYSTVGFGSFGVANGVLVWCAQPRRRPRTREVVSILIDESERHGEERRGILRVVAQRFLRGGGVHSIAFRRDDHAEQPDVTRGRQSGDLIV